MKIAKKWVMGFIIILILVVAASGCTSNNNQSTNNSSQQSSSSQSAKPYEQTSATQDVIIEVNYAGAWSGDILANNIEQAISGSGYQTYNLGKPKGYVRVNISKESQGTGTVTVKIRQGSNVLESQTSDSSYIILSHNF